MRPGDVAHDDDGVADEEHELMISSWRDEDDVSANNADFVVQCRSGDVSECGRIVAACRTQGIIVCYTIFWHFIT